MPVPHSLASLPKPARAGPAGNWVRFTPFASSGTRLGRVRGPIGFVSRISALGDLGLSRLDPELASFCTIDPGRLGLSVQRPLSDRPRPGGCSRPLALFVRPAWKGKTRRAKRRGPHPTAGVCRPIRRCRELQSWNHFPIGFASLNCTRVPYGGQVCCSHGNTGCSDSPALLRPP